MTEIRPIRIGEAEAFLQLLCDVFGLDFDRAYSVFFTEPMFELHRKWALIEGQQIVSILTTVPLQFGWGRAIGIAGVATREAQRREGYAGKLLERVVKESQRSGEGPALLFALRPELYEQHGFAVVDEVVRAPFDAVHFEEGEAKAIPNADVEEIYANWAQASPDRLRRDRRRWDYWKWGMRSGIPTGAGYFCQEGSLVREIVGAPPMPVLPIAPEVEWLGLRHVAELAELPLGPPRTELMLMGNGFPGKPELFMTDQF